MTPGLQQAIEAVYEAFEDVPRPTKIDGCPCCIEKKHVEILLSKPLRALLPDDLSSYAASAFLTVGDIADFLYLLPRILEILASDRGWWPGPEGVARAIRSSEFHSWPTSRKEALMIYFDEVFAELLSEEDIGFAIDSWVCALGRLHVDLTPYLQRIAANPERLNEFFKVNIESLQDGALDNDFWDDSPAESKLVVEWFLSPDTQSLIEVQNRLL